VERERFTPYTGGVNTGTISEIDVDDRSTWADRIFITFDIDWACDGILEDSVSLIEKGGLAATWMVTHETPVLDKIRKNARFELGAHPNFNPLLLADAPGSSLEILRTVKSLVPEAKTIRSHSLTQSTRLNAIFQEMGYTHDLNDIVPVSSGISLAPWHSWNGMIKTPFFWEDDVALYYPWNYAMTDLVRRPGLKIFNFHPIHVFLNTFDFAVYEATRSFHRDPEKLIAYRKSEPGVRTFLEKLIEACQ